MAHLATEHKRNWQVHGLTHTLIGRRMSGLFDLVFALRNEKHGALAFGLCEVAIFFELFKISFRFGLQS
jgi:hypothetical protein